MYKIKTAFGNSMIVRLSDNAHIPFSELNSDYVKYLKWVEEGNIAEEWIPEEV